MGLIGPGHEALGDVLTAIGWPFHDGRRRSHV